MRSISRRIQRVDRRIRGGGGSGKEWDGGKLETRGRKDGGMEQGPVFWLYMANIILRRSLVTLQLCGVLSFFAQVTFANQEITRSKTLQHVSYCISTEAKETLAVIENIYQYTISGSQSQIKTPHKQRTGRIFTYSSCVVM